MTSLPTQSILGEHGAWAAPPAAAHRHDHTLKTMNEQRQCPHLHQSQSH